MSNEGTISMLDYRLAVIVNEDRVRSHLRERSLQKQLEGVRREPKPPPADRRRWSIAGFVGLLVALRDARFSRGARPSAPNL
jgi:hypothetical protein